MPQFARFIGSSSSWCWLLALLPLFGCSALDAGTAKLFGLDDVEWQLNEPEVPEGTPTFAVEFRTRGGEVTKRLVAPVTGPIFLQQVLEKSRAIERYRRLDVHIERPRPDGQGTHNLAASFDHVQRRVASRSDYAIHPGDCVVVQEDTTSAFDDMLDTVLGPMGSMFGK